MSTVELRSEVEQYLDRVDHSFLRVVHSMLDTYIREQAIMPPSWVTQETVAERNQKLIKADDEIERGQFITLEQIKKKTE